ncbi:hypothetical protein SAMN00808754_1654 [Thermanaeromonas toyohensis ToBE]|uniref:Uncharacterized protein n=1 Tax=Thermanaeromonas toyohensis ToBE TaxID=698762 RepID=A0A1W1VVB1_9FIRM|nr:hypothetical protein [Thermanaeromonas toyohensis]SMB96794.1 hypothetical protein SAMN00808754_1654 [Thermanaeromonas toyohensis ToBE]
MSDALTDIRRDEVLASLRRELRRKEREFMAEPSREKAEELFLLWKKYYRSPHGYWSGPNRMMALERLAFYHGWTPEKGLGPLPAYYRPKDVAFIEFGAGFISNSSALEDLVADAIRRAFGGPVNYAKYLVKITVEPLKKVSCGECRLFSDYCGSLHCESKSLDELRKRIADAKSAEGLVR